MQCPSRLPGFRMLFWWRLHFLWGIFRCTHAIYFQRSPHNLTISEEPVLWGVSHPPLPNFCHSQCSAGRYNIFSYVCLSFYLQVEVPMWPLHIPIQTCSLGDSRPQPTWETPRPELFKLVHLVAHTSITKRAFSLRLKCRLLIIWLDACFRFVTITNCRFQKRVYFIHNRAFRTSHNYPGLSYSIIVLKIDLCEKSIHVDSK